MEEKNLIDFFFGSLFTQGLALGLFFCIVIYIRGFLRRRELRKNEMNALRQERDNLRITVQSLNQKPGRKEIRQYFIYQTALDIMFEKAPGFAPAWQITLKEAESLFEKSERGVVPLLKRLMPTTPDKQAEEYEKISRLSIADTVHK